MTVTCLHRMKCHPIFKVTVTCLHRMKCHPMFKVTVTCQQHEVPPDF